MIRDLSREEINIVTLEDPVEYHIPGVSQCQINEKTGMTFASGLRAILRQDPDIISVGEIRDGETASIAMRAAITGHLVFSTLHTNDAVSAVYRLKDVGVEPWLVASALRGVVSQRLLRKVCPHCKKGYQPSAEELALLGMPEDSHVTFYKAHQRGRQRGAADGGGPQKRLPLHEGELPPAGAGGCHLRRGGRPHHQYHSRRVIA